MKLNFPQPQISPKNLHLQKLSPPSNSPKKSQNIQEASFLLNLSCDYQIFHISR